MTGIDERSGGRAAAVLLALVLAAGGLGAQENADCLACHASDPALEGTRGGRSVSMYVEEEHLRGSVHRDLACVMCHQDLSGAELPHAEDLGPVDCGACHAETAEAQRVSLHGRAAARGDKLAPTCTTCHGTHAIHAATADDAPTAPMNVPLLCGRCHREGSPVALNRELSQERVLENYSESIHGRGLYEQGLTVTAVCTSCHTAHRILPHTDPASSIHRGNVAKTCARCHARIEQVHRKVVEGRLWEQEPHKIPACVDCHSPHKIRRVFYPAGMANKDCLRCHSDANLSMQRDGKTVSLWVDQAAYEATSHKGTACAQCHTDVTASRDRACETITKKVDCSICHAEPVRQYQASTHGTLAAQGDSDAPACLDCHEKHATQTKRLPSAPTFPRNVPALCGKCHQVGRQAAVRIHSDVPDIVGSYIDSIHGRGLLESGLVVTATCADCHTAHGELPPEDPRSTVHHDRIGDTCAKCHHGIAQVFRTSVHAPEAPEPGKKYPSCNNCHSSHAIRRKNEGDFRFAMMEQCGNCHATEAGTFFDTFHGKVSRLGSEGAAKCYDCHGTHGILPSDNPASTLGRENVVGTCGKCHAGSHRRFAGYLTHATHHDAEKYPWLFYSFWGMTALLVGTLTFALAHTGAWLVRLFLSREEWRAHKALAHAGGGKLYQRFDRYNRALHLAMMLSFFTLAITGMMLKFSYAGWAQWVAWLFGGFETTGVLHRVGAVVLFAVFALHVRRVLRQKKKEGRSWGEILAGPDTILFRLEDVRQIFQSIRWFLGLGPRPRYGRYTYWEKFDYFAVFWGVMVIGSTGLLLWFPEFFTHVVPGWFVNVATIIHSDEALLAVGFIFTIHFFNTHFRPDKFPMDPVIFTGRMTVAELQYDKPAEYEEMVRSGRLEAHLVEPIAARVERGFRIFGFVALALGLSLIAAIVFAMIFAYR